MARSAYSVTFRGLAMVAWLMGGAVLLSACNTAAGVGKDASAAGAAVSDTAKNLQKKLEK